MRSPGTATTATKKTHGVGQKQPNAFGLYDMLGNVWQWTADWYGIYLPEDAIDPQGPASGKHRSLRGGPFDGDDREVRVSMRAVLGAPERSDETVGFRCVAESPAPARPAPAPPPPSRDVQPSELDVTLRPPSSGSMPIQVIRASVTTGVPRPEQAIRKESATFADKEENHVFRLDRYK